jgi:hypothetical protein
MQVIVRKPGLPFLLLFLPVLTAAQMFKTRVFVNTSVTRVPSPETTGLSWARLFALLLGPLFSIGGPFIHPSV